MLSQLATRERRPLARLVSRRQHLRVTFTAARHIRRVLNDYSSCTFEDRDSEVALVALDAPTLFVVIIEAQVALEALDAKIDHVLLRVLSVKI